jgi:hypothetical protein
MSETAALRPASTRGATLAAFLTFVLLYLLAQRHGIRLSFDSYYYVEYAKEFRHHPPGSFGTAWPFGWPLLGAVSGVFGLSAYHGLWAWSVVCVAGTFCLGRHLVPWERMGLVGGGLLLAATGTFALTAVVAGVLSETSFAFVLLAFARCLARWPEPRAIIGSAALALAALCLRYAGGLAFVLLAAWGLAQLGRLRAAGRLPLALLAGAAAAALAAGLLAWNWSATGTFSGYARTVPVPSEWVGIASDFGWSLPSLLGGLGLSHVLGFASAARLPIGLILAAGVIALGWLGWRRAAATELRALGFLVAGYTIGLIVLRCLSKFDDLYNARMFVPLLMPWFLLVACLVPAPKIILAVCSGVLALNAGLCIRGASRQIGADVRPAVPIVETAQPDEIVAINDAAFTLSAHVPQAVLRTPGLRDPRWRNVRYVVIAAVPLDREARHSAFQPEWSELASTLLAAGRFQERLHTPQLIVLEQVRLSP